MRSWFSKRGIHPDQNKISDNRRIEEVALPDKLVIPLSQHIGAQCSPLVKIGDKIEQFQKVGDSDSFVSSLVHSPVSGKVVSIGTHPNPSGKDGLAIVIKPDPASKKRELVKRKDINRLEPKEIISIIREAGITGMGGAQFPTHVKLSIPDGKKADLLIINGSECEPYLTADSRLMTEHSDEIIKGTKILMKAIGVKKSIIGVENNKKNAINSLRSSLNTDTIKIAELETIYPQGAEKVLIKKITGLEVPSGGLPIEIGAVVINVGTAFAVYEAVYFSKPLIERVVTVTGDVKAPSNIRALIGTPFSHLIEKCGGYDKIPKKLLSGGPMMGITQYTDDVPITKGCNGILVFNSKHVKMFEGYEEEDCIRCGRCLDVCPMNLEPTNIVRYAKSRKYGFAKLNHAMDCFECGCCSYICPSKIDLVGWIKLAKGKIIEQEKEKK